MSWLVAGLMAVFVVLNLSGVETKLVTPLKQHINPLLGLSSNIKQSGNAQLKVVRLWPVAAKQIITWQNQLKSVVALEAKIKNLEEENAALRTKLDLPPRPKQQFLATTVISYPYPLVQIPERYQNLQGGTVMSQGVVLGFLGRIEAGYGQVELLSSRQARKVLVKVGDQGVNGVLEFDGRQLIITAIDRLATVTSGELVMTVGQTGIPPGLAVGKVGNVISAQTAPTQTVTVVQPTSLYQEKVVEILIP